MGSPQPLSEKERERIYQGRLTGRTVPEIAAELNRSPMVVRKWSRRIRNEGLQGLRTRKRGPKPEGILSHFDPEVSHTALHLKRTHRRWGANRVLIELRRSPPLAGKELPSRSRLAAFFKEKCPECVAPRRPRQSASQPQIRATAVHEIWQLDNKEKIELGDGEFATACNIRDPFGAAMIASRAFSTRTKKRWRKLKWTELRQTLRLAFTEWETLPDSIVTDNELAMAGTPCDPFPGKLTLWLVGLGVQHRLIRPHRPTDQSHVERNHLTLDRLTLDEESRANVVTLQQALDRERPIYNQCFPSRASDCAGRPPLVAHPELLLARHPYRPEWELTLFDPQRVCDYLASFVFERRVSPTGVVSLGRRPYGVGRPLAGKTLLVRCDPVQREWVFSEKARAAEEECEQERLRRPIKGIDAESLTGLRPETLTFEHPVQLLLPCLPS